MKAVVRAPGSCGELVQGTLNGVNFHITCPVDRFTETTVTLLPQMKQVTGPPERSKAVEAVRRQVSRGRGY